MSVYCYLYFIHDLWWTVNCFEKYIYQKTATGFRKSGLPFEGTRWPRARTPQQRTPDVSLFLANCHLYLANMLLRCFHSSQWADWLMRHVFFEPRSPAADVSAGRRTAESCVEVKLTILAPGNISSSLCRVGRQVWDSSMRVKRQKKCQRFVFELNIKFHTGPDVRLEARGCMCKLQRTAYQLLFWH